MYLARVIGNLVSTKKDERIVGYKLLIVNLLSSGGEASDKNVIAVDTVGAGIGEIVLLVEGSSARKAINENESPIDAAIVGIVDNMEVAAE
jgi:microcompartment protein CcmK/EutM